MMEWSIRKKQPGANQPDVDEITEIEVKLKGSDLAALFTDHIVISKMQIGKHLFEYAVTLEKRDFK